jgi:hypothetical protein
MPRWAAWARGLLAEPPARWSPDSNAESKRSCRRAPLISNGSARRIDNGHASIDSGLPGFSPFHNLDSAPDSNSQ